MPFDISKMKPIQRLSKEVVDRIAAGEVVQRPSAALKELLENSIDAGAGRINIASQDGGLSLLQITDDGSGIAEADLPLLCERFATSKLACFEDLLAMSTFGFRGEALASISHVAKITVTTKTKEARYAVKARYEDGQLVAGPSPTAGNGGTTMTIEALFHNMLVRRRAMLPKSAEEHARITDVIVRYAFAFPHVGFSLRKLGNSSSSGGTGAGNAAAGSGGVSAAALAAAKIEFNFPEKSTTIANLRQYYGHAIARALHPFSFNSNSGGEGGAFAASASASAALPPPQQFPISFHGFASDITLAHRRPIFILFINKRLVESAALRRTIDQAYAPFLVNDSKPFVFLDVTVAPDRLDVNVHPTKHEVLLLDEDRVCAALHETLTLFIRGLGDRSVAGNVTQRGARGMMDGEAGGAGGGGGRAMLGGGAGAFGKPPIDPQILNLKPVAGVTVQVAPSTMSRTVSQRGDLLRLFKSAKEREEQARLTAAQPFEENSYFDRSPNGLPQVLGGGNTPQSAASASQSLSASFSMADGPSSAQQQQQPFVVPSRPDQPPHQLRIDEVLDLTNLCEDDDDDDDNGYGMSAKQQQQQQIAAAAASNSSSSGNPLLSFMPSADDDSNSNIALAFPALEGGSDDEDAAEGALYGSGDGGGVGGSGKRDGGDYDDSDGAMRLKAAMAEFQAYMLTQKGEGDDGDGGEGSKAKNAHAIAPHLFQKKATADGPSASAHSSSPLPVTAERPPFPSLAGGGGGEGSYSQSQSSSLLPTAPPPPPNISIRLEFVERKLAFLASPAHTSPEARHLFRSLAYVGVLSHEHVLAQSGTSLLMIDWRPLVAAISYQRLLVRWGRHRLVAFAAPPPPSTLATSASSSSSQQPHAKQSSSSSIASCPRVADLLRHCLAMDAAARRVEAGRRKDRAARRKMRRLERDLNGSNKARTVGGGGEDSDGDDADASLPPLPSLLSLLKTLSDWREMFAEYFGIILDYPPARTTSAVLLSSSNVVAAAGGSSSPTSAGATAGTSSAAVYTNTSVADLRIAAAPVLLGDRWPLNQAAVPWLLYGLASRVDYNGPEEACFEGILRVITDTIGSGFFFQCPSASQKGPAVSASASASGGHGGSRQSWLPRQVGSVGAEERPDEPEARCPTGAVAVGEKRPRDGDNGNGAVVDVDASDSRKEEGEEENDASAAAMMMPPSAPSSSTQQQHQQQKLINSVDSPRMIMTFPQCHDAFVDAVQGALLPSVASATLFQPPSRLLTDGTVKSVVTVEALYKVFERC